MNQDYLDPRNAEGMPNLADSAIALDFLLSVLDIYRAVDVVEEGRLFQIHEHPNPQCPVGANIQAVLEVILQRAQAAMENVLRKIRLHDVVTALAQKIEANRLSF